MMHTTADSDNDSSYEQQLKNAFLKGALQPISSFVTKHMIDHRSAWLNNTLEYARHAERHFKEKKKAKKANAFVLQTDEGEEVYFQAEGGGRGRGRRRGRGYFRGRDRSATPTPSGDAYWECGKVGHQARYCKNKRKGTRGSTDPPTNGWTA